MLRWIARFLLFRVLGGRALAALAVVGFIRRMLAGRRATITRMEPSPSLSTSTKAVPAPTPGPSPSARSSARSGPSSGP
jgi:hypothetical protein